MGNIKGVFFFKREILQNMGQDKIFKIFFLQILTYNRREFGCTKYSSFHQDAGTVDVF